MTTKLKKLIYERAEGRIRDLGINVDSYIFHMFGKKYEINRITQNVEEIK